MTESLLLLLFYCRRKLSKDSFTSTLCWLINNLLINSTNSLNIFHRLYDQDHLIKILENHKSFISRKSWHNFWQFPWSWQVEGLIEAGGGQQEDKLRLDQVRSSDCPPWPLRLLLPGQPSVTATIGWVKKQAEKLKSCEMKEGWIKNDEGWLKNDKGWKMNDEGWRMMISSCWRVLL